LARPTTIVSNALAAQQAAVSARNAAFPGVGPAGTYNMWTQGRSSPGLPRSVEDFLGGAFGPLSPILPMPINEPSESGRPYPRRWQMPVGWNLPVGQPGSEGLKLASFSTLRAAADAYSVVRAMLNIRIGEMGGMNWDVGPTADTQAATKGDKGAVKDQRERAAQIVKWFRRVDPNYSGFQSWFEALQEEQHVTDAVSIFMHPTRVPGKGLFGTDLAALEAIDGSTVRPLMDITGATPRPPNVAYQQYLWGVPRVDLMSLMVNDDLDAIQDAMEDAGIDGDPTQEYRADQLLYLPRKRRVFTPYGFSSIEQSLMPISIGLNRQQFLLNFFVEGSIPGVFVVAGQGIVTPTQQQHLQDTLNAVAGDQAWKHRIIVLPAGSRTDPQKDMAWTQGVDQTIVEQVAMILHIQMQEISMLPGGKSAGLGGKGATEAQMDSVAETRTRPDRKWWKESAFDWLIQQYWHQEDLEFKWMDFVEDEDELSKAQAEVAMITAGKLSIDETRIDEGLDPWNTPFTSKPYIVVNNQIVSLDPTIAPYPTAPTPAPSPFGGGGTPFGGNQAPPFTSPVAKPEDGQKPAPTSGKEPGQSSTLQSGAKPVVGQPSAPTGQQGAAPKPAARQASTTPPTKPGTKPAVPQTTPVPPPAEQPPAAEQEPKPLQPRLEPGQRSAVDVMAESSKKKPTGKITVADLIKGHVKYKGDLTSTVMDYLRRSYPESVLGWVKDGDWEEYDPKVKLGDINMARRPGGRDQEKVQEISKTLQRGASMEPVVLVERVDQSEYLYDVADGWHRLLAAEDAKWDDVPAFIGSGYKETGLDAPWGNAMQDASASRKAAVAELAVLRRFVRKGGLVENFRTAALGTDVMDMLADDLTNMERDTAFERARERIVKGVHVFDPELPEEDKSITLSQPLASGLVPFDLAGQQVPYGGADACPVCGKAFTLDGECPEHGKPESAGTTKKWSEIRRQKGAPEYEDTVGNLAGSRKGEEPDLLKVIDAELARRGVDVTKAAEPEEPAAPAAEAE